MNLKKLLILTIVTLLYSACSSKEDFYRANYNSFYDDKFCASPRECQEKQLGHKQNNQNSKISYDEYNENIKPH